MSKLFKIRVQENEWRSFTSSFRRTTGLRTTSYVRILACPVIFAISSVIIITMYATIRHRNDLPWFIYYSNVFVGVVITLATAWFFYDLLTGIQNSEDVVGRLQDPTDALKSGLYKREELDGFRRRAKAMRPLRVSLWVFSEATLDLPVAMWDEILNQLFFLLSF